MQKEPRCIRRKWLISTRLYSNDDAIGVYIYSGPGSTKRRKLRSQRDKRKMKTSPTISGSWLKFVKCLLYFDDGSTLESWYPLGHVRGLWASHAASISGWCFNYISNFVSLNNSTPKFQHFTPYPFTLTPPTPSQLIASNDITQHLFFFCLTQPSHLWDLMKSSACLIYF